MRVLSLLALCLAFLCGADYSTVSIENGVARVVISTQRGSIDRFELIHLHPLELPEHFIQDLHAGGKPGAEGKPALAVLGAHVESPSATATEWARNQHGWLANQSADHYVYGLTGKDGAPWTVVAPRPDQVSLEYDNARGQTYRITYRMDATRPTVHTTLEVRHQGAGDLRLAPRMFPINGIHQDFPGGESAYIQTFVHRNNAIEAHTVSVPGTVDLGSGGDYVGLKSRFFAAIWTPGRSEVGSASGAQVTAPAAIEEPVAQGPGGSLPQAQSAGPVVPAAFSARCVAYANRDLGATQGFLEVSFAPVTLRQGDRLMQEWSLTATSLRRDDLALLTPAEGQIAYTDGFHKFFRSLTDLLTWFLDGIVWVVRDQALAVVVMTLLIKLAMFKLTYKQHESMFKMQKLAPDLKLIQEQYKTDKQKMAVKQMELWKKHGVNPLGGCLPMLIQIPIFIALYQAFQYSADMRGAPFLWAPDLTLPDQVWGVPLSFLGGWVLSLNPLPILYIAVTIWMSLNQPMPTSGDETQIQMAKMMRWMPVIFGVIFYNFPSGLVLYFTINAILSTIEIRIVRRKLGMT